MEDAERVNFLPPRWNRRGSTLNGRPFHWRMCRTRCPRCTSRSRAWAWTNVEKDNPITAGGQDTLYSAKLDCFVDLGPRQKGAHMSRFEEVVNDAIGEVILGESALRAETLAEHIAEKVRDRQGARRAEVHVEARYPEHSPAPHSGILTQEIYTLHGVALASAAGTRRLSGVTAQGMTACPCAQTLVQASSPTGCSPTGSGRTRSSASSPPCRWRRTTSAGSHALRRLPGGLRHRRRRGRLLRSSRTRCRRRSTS